MTGPSMSPIVTALLPLVRSINARSFTKSEGSMEGCARELVPATSGIFFQTFDDRDAALLDGRDVNRLLPRQLFHSAHFDRRQVANFGDHAPIEGMPRPLLKFAAVPRQYSSVVRSPTQTPNLKQGTLRLMTCHNEVDPGHATDGLTGRFGAENGIGEPIVFLDVHAWVSKPPCVGGPRPVLFRTAMPS